jgi:hypothetical protein
MTILGFSLTHDGTLHYLPRRLGRWSWHLPVLAVVDSVGTTYLFALLQVMLPKGVLGFL